MIPATGRYLHNQRLGLIIDLRSELDKRYLYHVFNSNPVRAEIARTATGSKVRHTSPGRIGDIVIGLPSLDEQRKIITILDAIDRKVDLHKRKRAVLDNLFKALLHKLMIGKIRLDNLDLSALDRVPLEGVTA